MNLVQVDWPRILDFFPPERLSPKKQISSPIWDIPRDVAVAKKSDSKMTPC